MKRVTSLQLSLDYAVTALVLSVFSLFVQFSHAAPDSEALIFWAKSNENSIASINHNHWQSLLDKYVIHDHPSGINRFSYAKVSADDSDNLKLYLKKMQQLNPRNFNRAEQKAYWINIYNALTVTIILENYPVESITKLGESFFSFGPWDDKVAEIEGQKLSLNDIEHRILRPLFHDSRIHYAVNCASLSCPNLLPTAFTADNTDSLLEQAAHQYINHPRGVSFENSELKVSSIYHWYKDDFGGTDQALMAHLISYAEPPLAKQLKNYNGDIDHHYNWALNKP